MLFALLTLLTQLASKAPATVGVAALDLDTGRTVALRGNERFPMGSVFKLPVAIAFLKRVDRGEFELGQHVTIPVSAFAPGFSPIRDNANGKPVTLTYGEILAAMLRDSDNTAADFLLPKVGGPAAVTRELRALGIRDMRVDRSETEMDADLKKPGGVARYAADRRDTATPRAAIQLLRAIHRAEEGLSPASHALALRLMTETTTGARRIRALLPAGTVVTHKTGTMPGTANDIALVTSADGKHHLAIAIFTKAGKDDDLAPRERVMAEMAGAVYGDFVR